MEAKIEIAIKLLAGKINGTSNVTADEALKFTQAALNLAHTAATIEDTRQRKIE